MPGSRVFRRVRWAAGIATVLAVIAGLRYPGGTFQDHSTRGYRFFENFLSDLGMTVAHNGEANRLGAVLFVIALLVLVVGLGGSLVGFVRLHSATPESRLFARLAGVVGLVVCVCFAGVALTPENRLLGLHIFFTRSAWRLFVLVPLLLFVASLRGDVASGVRSAWLFLTVMLAGYVWVLDFGPRVSAPGGLVTQVTAQKIIAITAILSFVYLSIVAERRMVAAVGAARTLEPTPPT
jgi:hypothetical membrane protein